MPFLLCLPVEFSYLLIWDAVEGKVLASDISTESYEMLTEIQINHIDNINYDRQKYQNIKIAGKNDLFAL